MKFYQLLTTAQDERVQPNKEWKRTEYVKWSCKKCFTPVLRDDEPIPDIVVDDEIIPDHGILGFYDKVVVGIVMPQIAAALQLPSRDVAVGKIRTLSGQTHTSHVSFIIRPNARLRLYGSQSSWHGQCEVCGRTFENPIGKLSAKRSDIHGRIILGSVSGVTLFVSENVYADMREYHNRVFAKPILVID